MAGSDWSPRRFRIGVAEPPPPALAPPPEPSLDTADLSVLIRAYHGAPIEPPPAPVGLRAAQITIARGGFDDFQDRPIHVFVDDEPWGRLKYEASITREVKPGRHRVRAFNTLFSKTLEVDVRPAGHARFTCGNGFPRAGWLLMLILHVTYLRVRLEQEADAS